MGRPPAVQALRLKRQLHTGLAVLQVRHPDVIVYGKWLGFGAVGQ